MISLNSIFQLIFVMVKFSVLLEVRAESVNIICTSFGLRGKEDIKTQDYKKIYV
jgi:hypothetical protein